MLENPNLAHAQAIEHWARGDAGIRGQELRAAAKALRDLDEETHEQARLLGAGGERECRSWNEPCCANNLLEESSCLFLGAVFFLLGIALALIAYLVVHQPQLALPYVLIEI